MNGSNETRIVVLGKTGSGRSSVGNLILGDQLLEVESSPESEVNECQIQSAVINDKPTTVIDTPGFFDTNMSEKQLERVIVKCMAECAPGPHAFLIVLKVDRYTDQEKEVIHEILKYFSKEALQHAVVVFTHGDQLEEGQKIQDFTSESQSLSDLVKKCGGRCHVVDNKYWNNNNHGDYRSNQFQVGQLLNTIEMMKDRHGNYNNATFQEKRNRKIIKIAVCCITVGALLGAFYGIKVNQVSAKFDGSTGAVFGGIAGCFAAKNASSVKEGVQDTIEKVKKINNILT